MVHDTLRIGCTCELQSATHYDRKMYLHIGKIIHNVLGQLQHFSNCCNSAYHSTIVRQARDINVNLFHESFDITIRPGNRQEIYLQFGRNEDAWLIGEIKTGA